ncbi:hypothetical protein BDA96_09G177600 [Sorghum bicolor]|uniref:DUF1618 domain-containing protein n=1 Tax=Sorghum bicolor TaxID=4558 RepID=A0A921QB50_SORBI|nr:hypothetical protein BDA96_09G177600 [Sorghum bicolor]
MRLPLRGALVAGVCSRLRRGLSTAASRPQWAIVNGTGLLVNSTSRRATLQLAEHPRFSELLVPSHLINPLPRINSDLESVGLFGGMVCATSGDGLLLLEFRDGPATPAFAAKVRAARESQSRTVTVSGNTHDIDPDITRFVCNPLSGEIFRLPDIDGTKKVRGHHAKGILTQSVRGHGPPDRYAVVELSMEGEGDKGTFVMRRFFSETRVVAFAGRLWWVDDLTWGAVSADPFSEQPELRFVELPRASVRPVPGPGKNEIPVQGMHRRMGVSEGKLRYVEVSQRQPFVLSSYALDDDGDCWRLEHQVARSPLLANAGTQEGTPRIGVIDPLNAHAVYVIHRNRALVIDMYTRKVLASSLMTDVPANPVAAACFSSLLKACVLPPWLGTTRIPYAGTLSGNIKSKTLPDVLVRVDRDAEN